MSVLDMPTPFTGGQSYTQTVTLEGSRFGLQYDFNQRCSSWYLSIADADGVDIYNGIKLVTQFDLLAKCKDIRRPGAQAGNAPYAGALLLISSTADISPAGLLDLAPGAGRCGLVYVTSDTVAMIAAGGLATFLASLTANAGSNGLSTYGQA